MKTLFRILGTAAAVAVTGAAIVVLDKILNQKDPLHVEEVEFPAEAEQDAAEQRDEDAQLRPRADEHALGVGDERAEIRHGADAEEDERREYDPLDAF